MDWEKVFLQIALIVQSMLLAHCNGIFSFNRLYKDYYEFIEESHRLRYKVKCSLIYCLIWFVLLRLLFYVHNPAYIATSCYYDYIVAFIQFTNNDEKDNLFFLNMCILFMLITVIVEYFFYFSPKDVVSWLVYKDVMFNVQKFYQDAQYPSEKVQEIILDKFSAKREHSLLPDRLLLYLCKLEMFIKFEGIDQELFAQPDMIMYKRASFSVRREAVLVLFLLQLFFTKLRIITCECLDYHILTLIIFVSPSLIVFNLIVITTLMIYRMNIHLLICIDSILVFQIVLQAVTAGYRLMAAPLMTSVLYRGVLLSANRQLMRGTQIASNKLKSSVSDQISSYAILFRFITEHVWVSRWFLHANKGMQKYVICAVCMLSFGANTYSLSQFVLLKGSMSFIKSFLCAQLVIVQFTMAILAASPLAYCSSLHHSSAKILPRTQLALSEKNCRILKLKLLTVYERITHGRKYGIKVGPTAVITRTFIFRNILIYLAYLFSFMRSFSIQTISP